MAPVGTGAQQPQGNHMTILLFFCDPLLYRHGLEDRKATEERKWNEMGDTGGQHGTQQALATSPAFRIMGIRMTYGLFPYRPIGQDSSMHAADSPRP